MTILAPVLRFPTDIILVSLQILVKGPLRYIAFSSRLRFKTMEETNELLPFRPCLFSGCSAINPKAIECRLIDEIDAWDRPARASPLLLKARPSRGQHHIDFNTKSAMFAGCIFWSCGLQVITYARAVVASFRLLCFFREAARLRHTKNVNPFRISSTRLPA